MSEQFSLKRNIIWNSIGTSIYTLCQALTMILVLRLSNLTIANDFSLAIAATTIFQNLANYSIRNYQVSDLVPKFKSGIYMSARILTCAGSIILCFIFVLFNSYSLQQDICILLYMTFRACEVIVDTLYGIDQIAGRMDILSRSFIARGLLTLSSFVVSLLVTKNLSFSILLMGVSTLAVAIIYDIPRSKRFNSIKPVFDFKKIKALLLECLPLAINLFIAGCIISIPRLYLQNEYPKTNYIGIYTMVASPILIVQLLSSYLLTPLLTALAQHIVNKDVKAFIKLTINCTFVLIGIAIAAVLGALLLGKFALFVLFGNGIAAYYYLLLPAIYYALLQLAANLISTVFTVLRKLILLTVSNVILLATCVIGAPFLIKSYQMQGVNLTLIIATFFQIAFLGIAMIFFLIKYLKHRKVDSNET